MKNPSPCVQFATLAAVDSEAVLEINTLNFSEVMANKIGFWKETQMVASVVFFLMAEQKILRYTVCAHMRVCV